MFGFLAPLIGAIGGGAGVAAGLKAAAPALIGSAASALSAKKARSQSKRDSFTQFSRLRDAAEHGGFNPLTALQYTGGGTMGLASSAPPLASIQLLTEGLQAASDEWTGVASQRRMKDQLELDLAKIRLDQARAEVTAGSIARPRIGAGSVAAGVTSTGIATVPQGPVEVDTSGSVAKAEELYVEYVRPDGSTVRVPVGTELDEVVTGAAIEGYGRFRDSPTARVMSDIFHKYTPLGSVASMIGKAYQGAISIADPATQTAPRSTARGVSMGQGYSGPAFNPLVKKAP